MFISRLKLNPRYRQVRLDLGNCQELHRTLLTAFPQADSEAARAEFGLLFRVEANTRTGTVSLLAQSRIQPDWSRLPKEYLLDETGNPACQSIAQKYSTDVLCNQRHFRFRLRANPTRKIETKSLADGTKRNGKRVELTVEEDQIAWFERKAAAAGFQVVQLRVNPERSNLRVNTESKLVGWRSHDEHGREKRRLTFGSVLFEGELTIKDAEQFQETIKTGIGPGKAYGFGLLSIAPA